MRRSANAQLSRRSFVDLIGDGAVWEVFSKCDGRASGVSDATLTKERTNPHRVPLLREPTERKPALVLIHRSDHGGEIAACESATSWLQYLQLPLELFRAHRRVHRMSARRRGRRPGVG